MQHKSHLLRGFTLVEMLVALAVAGILSIAILAAMGFGSAQDTSNGQIMQRNDNARAILAMITKDVQSAGFLSQATQSSCALSLAYDSQATPNYIPQAPVWVSSQASNQSLPLATTAPAYPPSGVSPNIAQALYLREAPSGSAFFKQTSVPIYVVQFGTTQSSSGSGSVSSTQLPVSTLQLNTTQGIQPGDMLQVQVPMNGGNVCFRAPVCSIGSTSGGGTANVDSKSCTMGSQYMPSNGYQDYAAQVPSAYGSLTNSNMMHATLVDMGQGTGTINIIQYWISQQSPNTEPVLMRTVFNALTDTLIQSQAVAPGVESLQLLFGTVANSATPGTVAPIWKTWGDVAPTDTVVAVDVALVIRTLQNDPTYAAPATIMVPQPAPGLTAPDAFLPVTPQPWERQRHYQVLTEMIAMRNTLWNN